MQRSFTVHGDEEFAQRRRAELVADFGVSRVNFTTEAARLTVAQLRERFFAAPHLWKPATVRSHRPVVRALIDDDLGRRRLVTLTAGDVQATIRRWQKAGLSVPTVSGRWLVLRSAVSWAVGEGILRSNPLAAMRGPARPEPRLHHSPHEVRALLSAAQAITNSAAERLATQPGSAHHQGLLFAAEQTLILVRLAADSAARRGELAVLRLGDLDGRVLIIERGLSDGVIGTTKSSRTRRLTLGRTTVQMIGDMSSSGTNGGPVRAGGTGCSPPTRPGSTTSPSARCPTGSGASGRPRASRPQPSTGSATAWPRTWSTRASS